MKFIPVSFLFCMLFLAAPCAFSAPDEAPAAPAPDPQPGFVEARLQPYGTRCMEKLDFGAHNFMTGWSNFISVPAQRRAESKKIMPLISGIGEGLILGTVDTAGGLLNMATFPVTAKLPLPKGGVEV